MSTGLSEPKLSFDDILEAVKESRRGRWFLDELEQRHRKSDTANVMSAIAKLESAIAALPAAAGTGDLAALVRAKSAIAQARRDIASFEAKPIELSEEGQLFAKLADMARKSFAAPDASAPEAAVSRGIVRALRLVDELDRDLSGSASAPAIKSETKYFQQDAAVFENPSASAKPISAKIEAGAKSRDTETLGRGAKLVIHRTPVTASPTPAPEPAADNAAQTGEHNGRTEARIVIIRRKPEDLMNVPHVDSEMEASAA